jgi:hypothetical protein
VAGEVVDSQEVHTASQQPLLGLLELRQLGLAAAHHLQQQQQQQQQQGNSSG